MRLIVLRGREGVKFFYLQSEICGNLYCGDPTGEQLLLLDA